MIRDTLSEQTTKNNYDFVIFVTLVIFVDGRWPSSGSGGPKEVIR
jgi:hypothetical protein